MKKDERALLDAYTKILTLANTEDAFREGHTYDLMYVNPALADKLFAFLRKQGRQLVFVVVNFSDNPAACEVCWPRHVFDYWKMEPKACQATDLLTGESMPLSISPDEPVCVEVPAWGGRAYKVVL
jgi:glycosidase